MITFGSIIKKVIIFSVLMLSLAEVSAEPKNHTEMVVRVALPMQSGFAERDIEGNYSGYTYDYLMKISQFTNWQYEFVEIDGNVLEQKEKIREMLENREIDLVGPVEKVYGFSDFADYTAYQYGTVYNTLSVSTENKTISEQDYRTMKNLKIAVMSGDSDRIMELEEFCSSNNITYELVEIKSDEEMRRVLDDGRADAVLGISTQKIENTRTIAKFSSKPFYFAAAKGNFIILNGLNMAFNKIDQTDPYFIAKINKKYFTDVIPSLLLTEAEREYIENNPVLKVLAADGIAPIQYFDKEGKLHGVSKGVMEEIASMTGFEIEYVGMESISRIFKEKDADIVLGVPLNYNRDEFPRMTLSTPYFDTGIVMFIRSSLYPSSLENKKYAAIVGYELPEDVNRENAIFFNSREAAMDAVEFGIADYGYGNVYSVSFYTIKNEYKNIVAVPKIQETLEYCMGFLSNDKLLESIINKSIISIDDKKMQNIILEATSQASRKLTVPLVLEAYGEEVTVFLSLVFILIAAGIVYIVHTNKKLKMQNMLYTLLADISNEYIFEYNVRDDVLKLSEEFAQLLGTGRMLRGYKNHLKELIVSQGREFSEPGSLVDNVDQIYEINIPLADGSEGCFKVTSTRLSGSGQKVEYIIGKLTDISEENARKRELIRKAERDGLTDLYNVATSKEEIAQLMKNRKEGTMDAFIILDVDYFKEVNDNYGHYAGDKVLQSLAEILRMTFRSTDVAGRLGGDEFCVYMKDVPSERFVRSKCKKLNDMVVNQSEGINVSLSIGVVIVDKDMDYEEMYRKADDALYHAKRNGRNQFAVYTDNE